MPNRSLRNVLRLKGSLVGFTLLSFIAPAGHLAAQDPPPHASPAARALVEDLRSDNVPGNAAYGVMGAIPRPPAGLSGLLEDALDSDDYQQRQFATYLYLRLYSSVNLGPRVYDNMIEGLGDDDIYQFNSAFGNASYFSDYFDRRNLPADFKTRLVDALEDADRQRRQFATWLLARHYQATGVAPTEWPPAVFRNLVEGLADDSIHEWETFNNHSKFLLVLHDLAEARPEGLLREALAGEDAQTRFGAACILAHYHAPSVQPEVSNVLWEHLADDHAGGNGVAAFAFLIELGRENALQLLEGRPATDWQQSAFAQCLAG